MLLLVQWFHDFYSRIALDHVSIKYWKDRLAQVKHMLRSTCEPIVPIIYHVIESNAQMSIGTRNLKPLYLIININWCEPE